jgi:hypothetical protein
VSGVGARSGTDGLLLRAPASDLAERNSRRTLDAMITHVVMWKLKDRTPENVRRVHGLLLGMKGKIPGMLELEAGVDFARSERSYDLVLVTRHINREALDQYQVHPAHQAVKQHMLELRDISAAVDFET